MEGKSVLFKRFADVDSVDIEVLTQDADELVVVVKNSADLRGINLEDIKSPDCFVIGSSCRICSTSRCSTTTSTARRSLQRRLINACAITGRRIEDVKVVLNARARRGSPRSS